jgi:hypothetical protein
LKILKKNIQQKINKTGATKVLFFDEARFGTDTKKGVLNNKVYMDLKDLEKALCQFINLMDPLQVKQICSANYLTS